VKLSDIVEKKVLSGIKGLSDHGVLQVEREQYDWECWPFPQPSPDGKGTITTYIIALFYPAGPSDHVTHARVLLDPYYPQQKVDELIWLMVQDIRAELEAFGAIPAAPARSPGGLIPG